MARGRSPASPTYMAGAKVKRTCSEAFLAVREASKPSRVRLFSRLVSALAVGLSAHYKTRAVKYDILPYITCVMLVAE